MAPEATGEQEEERKSEAGDPTVRWERGRRSDGSGEETDGSGEVDDGSGEDKARSRVKVRD